ncbi:MAG: hypothetical protein J6Y80_06245, partial [Victivallales bacterium]|nr:hypothetical protein [Victivallales bacterium]
EVALTELSGTGRSVLANDILVDMLLHVKKRQLLAGTMAWMSGLLRGLRSADEASALQNLWNAYGQLRLEQWNRLRPGIPHPKLDELLEQAREAIRTALERVGNARSVLELRLVLPDWHGTQRLEIALGDGGNDFQTIYEGLPKPADDGERPYYILDIPHGHVQAHAMRLRSTGRNGLGVVHATIKTSHAADLVPRKVTYVSGEVANPLNLLADDTTWCTLGDRDGVGNFFRTELHPIVHELVVEFGTADVPSAPCVASGTALPSIQSVAAELGLTLQKDTAQGWNAALLQEPFPDFLTAKVAEQRWAWIGGTVTPELHRDFEQVEFAARKNLALRLWASYFLQHIIIHGADAHTGLPDRLLGKLAGLYQLMVLMGSIPYMPNQLTATWMRGMSDSYRAGHGGQLGIWERSGGWLHRQINGEVVRLGRLEYEVLKTPLDFIPMAELPGIREGDPVIAIHIPGGFPLAPQEVDDSLEKMKEHFAALNPRYAVCHSWLLNPILAEKMPASNFAHFQGLGKLLEQAPSEEFPYFVFGKDSATEIDWKNLKPASRLQKIFQDVYLAGQKAYSWGMVVTL